MIEIWLFGWLVTTLPSAFSVVLLLVALTSVTYLATTLAPALGANARGPRILKMGLASASSALGAALIGLRVGGAGSGGELIPTVAVSVATAAACGAATAFAALGAGALAVRLGAAQTRRSAALVSALKQERRQLEASRRAFFEGDDLHAEVADAEASLARLGAALDKLASTHAAVVERLGGLDDEGHAGDLGRELRRTRDEVATKLDLGRRIHGAATAAAFRLSCTAILRGLLRRRPRDVTRGITHGADDAAAATAALAAMTAMVASIDDFLADADRARGALEALSGRRPPRSEHEDPEDDPQAQAMLDLEAIGGAYAAVRDRLGVVVVRSGARADIEAVASAAGEVSHKARAAGIPADDLQELVTEVARAESAILLVTPAELDGRGLTDALSRSAAALSGHDGASLDALLRALHELA